MLKTACLLGVCLLSAAHAACPAAGVESSSAIATWAASLGPTTVAKIVRAEELDADRGYLIPKNLVTPQAEAEFRAWWYREAFSINIALSLSLISIWAALLARTIWEPWDGCPTDWPPSLLPVVATLCLSALLGLVGLVGLHLLADRTAAWSIARLYFPAISICSLLPYAYQVREWCATGVDVFDVCSAEATAAHAANEAADAAAGTYSEPWLAIGLARVPIELLTSCLVGVIYLMPTRGVHRLALASATVFHIALGAIEFTAYLHGHTRPIAGSRGPVVPRRTLPPLGWNLARVWGAADPALRYHVVVYAVGVVAFAVGWSSIQCSLAEHARARYWGERLRLEGGTGGEVGGKARQERAWSPSVVGKEASCVACMSGRRAFAMVPCGHRCLCAECGEKIIAGQQACPICRGPISGVLRVYET